MTEQEIETLKQAKQILDLHANRLDELEQMHKQTLSYYKKLNRMLKKTISVTSGAESKNYTEITVDGFTCRRGTTLHEFWDTVRVLDMGQTCAISFDTITYVNCRKCLATVNHRNMYKMFRGNKSICGTFYRVIRVK